MRCVENRMSGWHAVAGDEELRLPLRKASPVSADMASLAQLLSCPAAPAEPGRGDDHKQNGCSSSGHDENRAPPNGAPAIASHVLKF